MKVAVVVGHPDDELLGVGGTILRHILNGDDVEVHIECVQGLRDYSVRIPVAYRLASELGYTVRLGTSRQLGDTFPSLSIAAEIVYTHHPGDLNRDHRLVSEAVQVACRPYTSDVHSLRFFETPSSTEWGEPFAPSMFVDISAHLGEKVHAILEYETEVRDWPHPRSQRAIIARAQHWGSVSGYQAAEAFVVGRERW